MRAATGTGRDRRPTSGAWLARSAALARLAAVATALAASGPAHAQEGVRAGVVAAASQITGSPKRIRGLVVPRQQATISAAQPATIVAIGPDSGERFETGAVLVRFDCGIYDAELKRARAIAEAAQDTHKVKLELAQSGSIAKLQAILAAAELKKAGADVVVAEARVATCVIPAPFAGRVVRRVANAHETVAPRDPLIEIVDDSSVEVRAFVPSIRLGELATGGLLRLLVDETGLAVAATIVSVGAAIDNVSQLIEVRARPRNGADGLLPGMSGRVELGPRSTER